MAAEAEVTVKTTENTNTVHDLRTVDRSWGWRRTLFFGTTFGSMAIIGFLIYGRLDHLSDPVLLKYVEYSYWTMWLAMCLYGAQSTLSEVAEATAIFFSGKRTILTQAPRNAVVETTAAPQGTGVKVAAGEPAATVLAAEQSSSKQVVETVPVGVNAEAPPWARK